MKEGFNKVTEITHTSEPGDLPHSYGETKVVLLPVEPYSMHAYWEVTLGELEKVKRCLGVAYRQSQAVLRFYDVTNIIFDGTNANSFFDVNIDLQARNWYIRLWSPGKSYFVELAFRTKDGQSFPLARSNTADTPPAWPAPKTDEYYMIVVGDYDLLQDVPIPIEIKASHEVVPPIASQEEPESPSGEEVEQFSRLCSPLAAEENSVRGEAHEDPSCDDRMESGRHIEPVDMSKWEPVLKSGVLTEESSESRSSLMAEENSSRGEFHENSPGEDDVQTEKSNGTVELSREESVFKLSLSFEGSSKGEERPSEIRIARPMDSPHIPPKNPAKHDIFQLRGKPPFKPELLSTQDIHARYKEEGKPDLTEMAEKWFTPGVSSKQNRSRRLKGSAIRLAAKRFLGM